MNKAGSVVLDIESLMQASDNYSGSPKMTVSNLTDNSSYHGYSSYLQLRNFSRHGFLEFSYLIPSSKQKALSRKGSSRMDRRNGEEQEEDEDSRKIDAKGMQF